MNTDNAKRAKKILIAKLCARIIFVIALWAAPFLSLADELSSVSNNTGVGISSNPAAANFNTGNGDLGKLLFNLNEDSAFRLGGSWIGDGDLLFSGGQSEQNLTGNSLLILGLTIDMQKLSLWNGGLFGVQLLRFDGMPSNSDAGTVQGYDSLTGPPPLNRTELYQLWYRQTLFNDKFIIRVGKTIPTYDFNNVLRSVPVRDKALAIPSVTGLLFTPVYVNPSLLGVIPGYYNTAYGVTSTFAPTKQFYVSAGAYDGNLANGAQTGLDGPHFNGYYFLITEAGYAWEAGAEKKTGMLAVGGWDQTGELTAPNGIVDNGTQGLYAFGSQFLWYRNPGADSSGIIGIFSWELIIRRHLLCKNM